MQRDKENSTEGAYSLVTKGVICYNDDDADEQMGLKKKMQTNDCLTGREATRNNNKGKTSIPLQSSQNKSAEIENEKKYRDLPSKLNPLAPSH